MSYLPAALAAVGVLCLVNLVLTFAVMRQVRRHGEKLARTIPGGAGQVLAVIAGEEKDAAKFGAELGEVASVVIEPGHGPVATAFSTYGRPSFYLVGADGRV